MATIRDVAKRSGVSIATVSNVLNAKDERVSSETRDRVLAAVRDLRYRPTAAESSQKAMATHTIAVIVGDLTFHPIVRHGYFRAILDGILEVALMRSWHVTLTAQTMWDDIGNAVRHQFDGRCDACIFIAPQPGNTLVETLQKRGTPIVQVGTTPWLADVSSVDIDNRRAGALIAEEMVKMGHRRIGFVSERREHVSSIERREGLFSVPGPEFRDHFRIHEFADYLRVAREIRDLSPSRRPTALLGWHDSTALELGEALQQVGLRIPMDVSLVGVDNASDVESHIGGLTTIDNPLYEIGRSAAHLIVDREPEAPWIAQSILMEPKLIVRDSLAAAPTL